MAFVAQPAGPLRAGAAQVDITPQGPVHLAGDIATHRPAKLVADPLYAKALVLESGGRRLCLLTLDITIITDRYSRLIREQAAEPFGLDPAAVMVHALQSHSAPGMGRFMVDPDFPGIPAQHEWIGGDEEAYSLWAADRAVEAIGRAVEALEPVQIGMASGIEGRLAFNRRAVLRDGSIGMPGPTWPGGPLGPHWIRCIEGPMDPELGVICLRNAALRIVALVLHYTCHPVHVFPKPIVSADWPGAWAAEMQQRTGAGVALVVNGACGNINPWPPFDPDYVEDHRRMGRLLAQNAEGVLEAISFQDGTELGHCRRIAKLPLRELSPEELQRCEALLAAHPAPIFTDESQSLVDPEWIAAASVYSVHLMRQRAPHLDYEVQAFRLGPAAIVGLAGEPFVEAGLQIKLASPAYPTYIAHCCTQYVGYIPTAEALKRGGHEATTRYWAKLAPEAFGLIVAEAGEALRGLDW